MLNAAALQSQLIRAQSLQQGGRVADAWAAIAPLRKAIDQHGQALRLYALIASAVGEVDSAVDALRRILTIERDPPEIIGALADMLGKAGRHDQALVQWSRLAALQPGAADAHLNRAIAAADAGKLHLAIEAADTGLTHFPGHARLLAVRAMALKNDGQLDQSLAAFAEAVAADPTRALTRHNHAVALRASYRFDEACAAFAEAKRLGMSGAGLHANWAAAALEAGRVDEAAELYRRAIAADPAHTESKVGLTRLQVEYRGGDDAFVHYEQIAQASGRLIDWIEYANMLQLHRRNAEAAEVAARAIAKFGEDPLLVAIQATATGIEGDAGTALARLERAFAGRSDAPLSSMAMLALRAGDAVRAAAIAEEQTRLNPDDQAAWANLSIAWRLAGDPREDWLCDYARLVMVVEVPSPDGALSPGDFAAEVAAVLDPLHQSQSEPGDQSLRHGTQTSGALFARPDPAIQRFRAAIVAAATLAIDGLPADSTHPFLRRLSPQLDFAGSWSVRLSPGGHHVAHMHSQGWMSSAYYARLPQDDRQKWADQQGWIQFGVPPAMFDLDLAPRRVVEPAAGRLVLFPSYLWHGTLPFDQGDRLTAAFDFVPR
ncbi:putative 2OG-Fe(II) oxygenase [Sphingomonas sp.]|uniref:putative 2OG-Fe(II) oxygenase n=1 Tax=Sphingomonas sp. TaxID=28214 RepID=UPI00286BD859|nr:putative 2OG-Fe(II) oxygenase [Sphingomonas sp.]